MVHLLNVLRRAVLPESPQGTERPADVTYSKAERDAAYLTCKCPEPTCTDEDDPAEPRFLAPFKWPFY